MGQPLAEAVPQAILPGRGPPAASWLQGAGRHHGVGTDQVDEPPPSQPVKSVPPRQERKHRAVQRFGIDGTIQTKKQRIDSPPFN